MVEYASKSVSEQAGQIPSFPGMGLYLSFFHKFAQPRPVLDHIPIVLCEKMSRRDPKPFKFENMWLKSLDFVEFIRGWWDSLLVIEEQKPKA